MTTEYKHALYLGFSSKLVSQLLLLKKKTFSSLYSTWLNALVHWRQTYFRPNKPLPTNVGSNQSRLPIAPRQPFKWVIIDFFISCLFLCIPYVFFERIYLSNKIVDEESGLRDATSTLVICAYTCFVVRRLHFLLLGKPNLPCNVVSLPLY